MTPSRTIPGAQRSLSSSESTAPAPEKIIRNEDIAPHLHAEDVAELRAAIERSLCEGELQSSSRTDIDRDLRKALRVSCAKARLQRVRAEHVIIDLKQVWMTLPSMLLTHTEERLNRIVTACIDEYYAGEISPPG